MHIRGARRGRASPFGLFKNKITIERKKEI
jgi:hypothetical protein